MARSGRLRLHLAPNFADKLANSREVVKAREGVARRIASEAESRSRISRAAGKWRAEVDRSETPARVAAVAGDQRHRSFIVTFEEFGGTGFRPPPAPLRTAAARYGRVVYDRREVT